MTENDSAARGSEVTSTGPLCFCPADKTAAKKAPHIHIYGPAKAVCDTEKRGFKTPGNRSPLELVLHAGDGFVPLWAEGVTLHWRFQERSLLAFEDPDAARARIRSLMAKGLALWGDAVPVRFSEHNDLLDFEVVVRDQSRCSANGCVLASAFFPDAGQHELVLYPTLFEQIETEQIETLAHEFGHIFGLRHFFAQISETEWASETFGEQCRFTIMNYGPESVLTENDRRDLKTLYRLVWGGELKEINGTPVRLVQPFSAATTVPHVA
ncbi:reprolysin-like metallo-peptidase family M12B [Roseibium hamelinense]|uniref:Reprolysin-like metallo-peptidase family M12B n=1 Tax=Roseibium hamelinense TaxID=150831 RepID=A0A562SH28_9HYPH|nr:matrixin family metalloprotease [Roseibium hamelinense]MTI44167.1 matrix metalloproteinase-11 [Roseibium hamelinense]TWI80050.1 reprolysin-like metallo-peptidase family M12B [Roseibium hamelinense]